MTDAAQPAHGDGVRAAGAARQRAVRGVRAALILNLLGLPLSFVTNMILGRISPEALGAYGAIQVFVGSSFMFLVVGGAPVFTRFVPAIDEPLRIPFLRRYGAIVAGTFVVVIGLGLVVPGVAARILGPLGAPSPWIAAGLLAATTTSAMAVWYLYADKESTWAVTAEKLVVLGFFLAGLVALTGPRARLARGDASFLWAAALAVYASSAAVALWRITRTPAFAARRPGGFLPQGFWSIVGFTHVETLVTYVYVALAPTVIALWVDLRTLGFLHAAVRFTVLMTAFPVAVMAVLAPELRRLVAGGDRAEALRQARFAVEVALLALAPAVLALVLFAEPAMALFGPGFRAQADLLRWIAPSVLAAPVVLCGASLAVAVGRLGAYLRASIVYVAVAMAMLAVLVPNWGVLGAAAAMTLGAFARQIATAWVLWREGFAPIRRLAAAWACAAAALVGTLVLRPSPLVAAAAFVVLLVAFAVAGRVRWAEFSRIARWGLGRI